MNILNLLRSSTLDIEKAFWAMVEIAENEINQTFAFEELRCARYISSDGDRHLLEAAAKILLSYDRGKRFAVVEEFMDLDSNNEQWIRKDVSDQIVSMIESANSVRFCYDASLRPYLTFAMRKAEEVYQPEIEFWSNNPLTEFKFYDLVTVLDIAREAYFSTGEESDRRRAEAFDTEVIIPPLNAPVRNDVVIPAQVLSLLGAEQGRQGRLNLENLAIVEAILKPGSQAIIIVSDGALFRMVGVEPVMRKSLIETHRLKAVMGIPPGMLFASTSIRTNILVLAKFPEPGEYIRFVDLGHDQITKPGRRGRVDVLEGVYWASFLDGENLVYPGLFRDVSVREVVNQNYALMPERYLNTGPRERIDELLSNVQATKLNQVVEIIRPISFSSDERGEFTMLEVSPSDISDRGYIKPPSRRVTVDRGKYSKALSVILQPGDLLFAVKGTVGSVGLTPNNAPDAGSQTIWTVGQSMVILRPKMRLLDPIVLFEYLSDETVQAYLKSLSSGGTIPNLATKDLKDLLVPLPDSVIVAAVKQGFVERQKLFDEIETLNFEIKNVRARTWPHCELRPD